MKERDFGKLAAAGPTMQIPRRMLFSIAEAQFKTFS